MKPFSIYPIPAFKDNYIWAIVDATTNTALVVDPGDAEPVISFLKQQQLTLSAILITHHHNDHSGGIKRLKELYDPIIYAPRHSATAAATVFVDDLTVLTDSVFGEFRVLQIPGHTLEHVAYYHSNGWLFCGDTLFAAGCGRVFEGTFEQMYQSLMRLIALPDATEVYCGHEYTLANLAFAAAVEPDNKTIQTRIATVTLLREQQQPSLPSTLAIEKQTNPFLRCFEPSVIAAAEAHTGTRLDNPTAVFTALRQWKNDFKA